MAASEGVIEPQSKPTEWMCNACRFTGAPSNEHLIHIGIGRVILGNKGFSPDEVREQLRSGFFRDYGLYKSPTEEARIGPGWMNQEIRGLICRDCNGGWAKTLEEEASDNLYDFVHLRGAADALLLRRWAMFFAIKLWFSHSRTEFLADAPGGVVLEKLAKPETTISVPVRVVRLPFSSANWRFAANIRGWAGKSTPYIVWVIRSVAFLAVIAKTNTSFQLPIPNSVELTDGLRIHQVPTLRRTQVEPLFTSPPFISNRSRDWHELDS